MALNAAEAAAPITLRLAGEGDLDTLARLYVALSAAYGEMWPLEAAREKMAVRMAAGCQACLFEAEGEALGAAAWMDIGDHVFLLTFVIAEGHRRAGLGTLLFTRLREEVIGAERVMRLEAKDHAVPFWLAQGFATRAENFQLNTETGPTGGAA